MKKTLAAEIDFKCHPKQHKARLFLIQEKKLGAGNFELNGAWKRKRCVEMAKCWYSTLAAVQFGLVNKYNKNEDIASLLYPPKSIHPSLINSCLLHLVLTNTWQRFDKKQLFCLSFSVPLIVFFFFVLETLKNLLLLFCSPVH